MSILLKFVSNSNDERRVEGTEFIIFIGYKCEQSSNKILRKLRMTFEYMELKDL